MSTLSALRRVLLLETALLDIRDILADRMDVDPHKDGGPDVPNLEMRAVSIADEALTELVPGDPLIAARLDVLRKAISK